MSLVTILFHHQLTLKMFHFQTKTYGGHKAADGYLLKYTANLDRFMEVYQGEYGTIKDTKIDINFVVSNDENIDQHLMSMINYLNVMNGLSNGLQNIRDDMVADIQQLRYLLTFK